MAAHGGPNIPTDGLILNVDAGNQQSYSGSGTTCVDISDNGFNGTLINGLGYSSDNQGVFTLDGTNDFISFGAGNIFFPLPNFSVELWFSSDGTTPTTGTSPGLLGLTYGIRLFVYSNTLNYRLDNGSSATSITSPSIYDFYNSSWHQVVIQANSTTRYLYIDGDLAGTLTDSWSGSTRWPTNGMNIGRDNNNSNYYFRGKIGSIKIYDRVLTADEVQQNFSANRGRYGI